MVFRAQNSAKGQKTAVGGPWRISNQNFGQHHDQYGRSGPREKARASAGPIFHCFGPKKDCLIRSEAVHCGWGFDR